MRHHQEMAIENETEVLQAKPPVKMAGGKTRLLPELLKYVPEGIINHYYEPFFGGGALFWALANANRIKRATLSDLNEDLMAAYMAIRGWPGALVKHLRVMPNKKAFFEQQRKLVVTGNSETKFATIERAARFIYLNKTCFNGLWRVNKKGEFNVPFGYYENPTICDEDNIWACSDTLVLATLISCDFDSYVATIRKPRKGDFVYFDPPYYPISPTSSFTKYGKEGFTHDDHVRLRDYALKLKEQGVQVLLSNSDCEAIRALYKGRRWKLVQVHARRNINSKGHMRGPVPELIIR